MRDWDSLFINQVGDESITLREKHTSLQIGELFRYGLYPNRTHSHLGLQYQVKSRPQQNSFPIRDNSRKHDNYLAIPDIGEIFADTT